MKAGLHILFFCLFGCQKAKEIQDPHYKELIGTWTTFADTEKKTLSFTENGKLTMSYSAERGGYKWIKKFDYGKSFIIANGDTLQQYNCYGPWFYKKENSDTAYGVIFGTKINNQKVDDEFHHFVKIK